MSSLANKTNIAAQLQLNLTTLASEPEQGTDIMKLTQLLAGILVESTFLFDEADEALEGSLSRLAQQLGCGPAEGDLTRSALPPAHVLDFESECGRAMARTFFEDWLDCEYEFQELILYLIHYNMMQWEEAGQSRGESLRLFLECAQRCMALEISAQELCDLVIDRKIGRDGWTLGDSISGLSAVSGRRMALSISSEQCALFRGNELPDHLDQIAYVMTQEAIRLGIPAGSDWRFGLAANDVPVHPPIELINGLDPHCRKFFELIRLEDLHTQAVACAKAAGRMIAVAAGGEIPDIEPIIAKPLAMAAMTESYKSVCMQYSIASC